MIADAGGHMPAGLRNVADWKRFQRELDRAGAIVLGRTGHLAHPNRHGRNRIVMSSTAHAVEKREDAWWWNPAEADIEVALTRALPEGGIVAVPGGRRVFDLFLDIGYDEFHLVRARGVRIPGGIPLFSECTTGRTAEQVLMAHGLMSSRVDVLDAAAGITVAIWKQKKST